MNKSKQRLLLFGKAAILKPIRIDERSHFPSVRISAPPPINKRKPGGSKNPSNVETGSSNLDCDRI